MQPVRSGSLQPVCCVQSVLRRSLQPVCLLTRRAFPIFSEDTASREAAFLRSAPRLSPPWRPHAGVMDRSAGTQAAGAAFRRAFPRGDHERGATDDADRPDVPSRRADLPRARIRAGPGRGPLGDREIPLGLRRPDPSRRARAAESDGPSEAHRRRPGCGQEAAARARRHRVLRRPVSWPRAIHVRDPHMVATLAETRFIPNQDFSLRLRRVARRLVLRDPRLECPGAFFLPDRARNRRVPRLP